MGFIASVLSLLAIACAKPSIIKYETATETWSAIPRGLRRTWLETMPLSMWPMIQTHDAGTGYLGKASNPITAIVWDFARTQIGGVTQQLSCGARSMDWRPFMTTSNTLVFAHGSVIVNYSMAAAAAEVVAWAQTAGDSEDEMVLLIVADCNGAQCDSATIEAFEAVGIPVYTGEEGCAVANDWTLGTAMTASELHASGHVAAIINCPMSPTPTYNDRLGCTGFINVTEGVIFETEAMACLEKLSLSDSMDCLEAIAGILDFNAHYACYTGIKGRNATLPFSRLLDWLIATTSVPPSTTPGQRGLLTSIQGCWAQNVQSTVFSFLHDSSLIDDESQPHFNTWLAHLLASDTFKYVNLVGVNNVCDGGQAMLAAARTHIPATY